MASGSCERCGEGLDPGDEKLCYECEKEIRKIEWDEENVYHRISTTTPQK